MSKHVVGMIFTTVMQFYLQCKSHTSEHNFNGQTLYGWNSRDNHGRTNHLETIGSWAWGPFTLHASGLFVEGVSVIYFVIRQLNRFCTQTKYQRVNHKDNGKWTDGKNFKWYLNVISACVKGFGCLVYLCVASKDYYHLWCCLLSFLSIIFNVVTIACMHHAVKTHKGW